MAIGKIEALNKHFVGQSDIIMFDKPADYATATLSALANPESLGHIKLDSTSFTGEAASLEPLKNEQGKAYYILATEGTFGFEFFAASTSSEMLTEFFGAETISDTFTGDNGIPASAAVLGLMHKPAILERPIMIVNDTADRSIVIPRAKIVANLEMDGKEVGIRVNVSAEAIDTKTLKTVMFVEGELAYTKSDN
jgi:hypothetical protein